MMDPPEYDYDDESAHYAIRREQMVAYQLVRRGIVDARVLAAMGDVPREEFVPLWQRKEAYEDWPLEIGYGQTISQPFTVAYMAQALQLCGDESVLEIGTGSGYGAAVLSRLVKEVHTIERIPQLADEARKRLADLGYDNVHVYLANGTLGLPKFAPFDGIVVTAGADELPRPFVEQLAEGGRIVIPIGTPIHQTLFRFTRRGQQLKEEDLGQFAFVPLIGEHGGFKTPLR